MPHPTKVIERFTYRPEIDGLRAVAVIPVVLFHAGLGFPGGFVGVDVFFVISGYLITSLIVQDLEANRFSLLAFWERRARRIIPASVFVTSTTIAAAWWLLTPSDLDVFGATVTAHAVFAANIYFARTLSYFAGPADEEALLHTWSLAVEEQYYLVIPLVLLAVFRSNSLRTRTGLLTLAAAALVASFGYSAAAATANPNAAFYLLTSRAWELLLGSVVALLGASVIPRSAAIRTLLAWLALAAIAAACTLYDETVPYPGVAALLPCAGAAVFIWATRVPAMPGLLSPAALLSLAPVVFIGKISYSLYLWHWPIAAFTSYWTFGDLQPSAGALIVAASLVLAALSYRFVETPFRLRRLAPTRRSIFGYSALSLAGLLCIGAAIRYTDGFPTRLPASLRATLAEEREATAARDAQMPQVSLDDARAGSFLRLGDSAPTAPRVFVWGDSHARAALPALAAAAADAGVAVEAAWRGGTPPTLAYHVEPSLLGGADPVEFNAAVLRYLLAEPIADVLLVGYWRIYFDAALSGTPQVSFGDDLVATVGRLSEGGKRVWLLLDWPAHGGDVPRLLFGETRFGLDPERYAADVDTHRRDAVAMQAIAAELRRAGATVLDPSAAFLNATTGRYRLAADGALLYSDANHVSVRGAELLRPTLQPLVDAALRP